MKKALEYAEKNKQKFLDETCSLIKIRSISQDPGYAQEIRMAAAFLKDKLAEIGFADVRLLESGFAPVVFAQWTEAGENVPTILFYGHYDVVTADPLDAWHTSPFEPVIKDGSVFARGSNDDKCQIMGLIAAFESWFAAEGKLPVNVKICFEGEEETGSRGLEKVIQDNIELFDCNVAAIVDGAFMDKDTPVTGLGCRGLLGGEIFVYGPGSDVHSGNYGGIIHNPLQAAAEIIAKTHDPNGMIAIPHFYDDVSPISEEEHRNNLNIAPDDEFYIKQLGIPALYGNPDYLPMERTGNLPTFEIHGITGGYHGEGIKSAIPPMAGIKFSIRTVPRQSAGKLKKAVEEFVRSVTPEDVRTEVVFYKSSEWTESDINSPWMKVAEHWYESGYGKKPVYKRGGGTIGAIHYFETAPSHPFILSMGFGLPDDRLHGPNEKFSLDQFYKESNGTICMMDYLRDFQIK